MYWAVIECIPEARLDVAREALPLLRVALPNSVEPSKKRTVPVAAEGETVALNVTDCPTLDGLRLDVSDAVVFAAFTVCDSSGDVLPVKVASPAY